MVYPPGSFLQQQYTSPPSSSSSSSKRSSEIPASSSSNRPNKRRRKMDAMKDGRNDFEEPAEQEKQVQAAEGGAMSLLDSFMKRLGLWSGSSAPKVEETAAKGKGKQRQNETNDDDVENEEPDEDDPSPFQREQEAASSASSRNYGSNGTSYVKRQPMYSNDAKASSRAKSQARLQLLRGSSLSTLSRSNSGYTHSSSSTALFSPSTPTSSASLATPNSLRNNVDAFRRQPLESPGVTPVRMPGSYAQYYKTVNEVNDAFGTSVPIMSRSGSYSGKYAKGDVLAAKRPPKQQRYPTLDRVLSNSKEALEYQKPSLPSLKSFNRLNLKDQKTSDEIDDLGRRRRKWPAQTPPEVAKLVKSVFIQRGVISALPAAEVSAKDIIKLRPGEWLNDEVINFYGVMVNLRSAAAKDRRDKEKAREEDEDLLDVHVFSSFFFAKLDSNGYQGVKKWSKKFDFFKKDIVIMPVNLGNAHWVCAAINVAKKRIEYYDSMGRINYGVTDKLMAYVEAEHLEKKKSKLDSTQWEVYSNPKTPQQANGYDCGVFTSQFIECLSRKDGHFDFSQHNMQYLRSKMVAEIKNMELMPEEWM